MRTKDTKANKLLVNLKRSQLANNVQRVLLSLVMADSKDGWVPRTALRVPSASARVRDLRKSDFGGFKVECVSAQELNKASRSQQTNRQTYYRIVPSSVTVSSLRRALKGVI